MLKTIAKTIHQHSMLSQGDGVIVGLSGGADSVTLLSALMALGDEMSLSVYAVHINHNLRGSAARQDEIFVRNLCQDADVPLIVYSADVQGYANKHKLGIEEAGRNIRYKYLHQSLKTFDAQKIAVGHNQDDNAETILLNLFRGTGLKGLCGIPPVNGSIIRPLIGVSRKEIEAYAAENTLEFITDETNASLDYSRNYVRNEIIPIICKQFGEQVPATIARNAALLTADEEALAATAYDAFVKGHSADRADQLPVGAATCRPQPCITLPINQLLSHPTAITRRIIREAISSLRGVQSLEDIQAAHIEAIIDIAKGQTGREASLPRFKACREYANLILRKIQENQNSGFCHNLTPNNPICIQHITITLNLLQPPQNQGQTHCTHSFNYDKVKGLLELRTRRPGDKITLPSGTKKLQDYFTDTKTPRSQRDEIPLLASGSSILWIMDKHNRISTAYQPEDGQSICWVTCISSRFDQKR
ncbi:MAG: tRNA lysidine(34) synthetase TilS [Defluviitaleaceae bacterium]|nr:tRNA lysidine(34) synthetase TilS [Defluviitaleaceae bacterium]